jgi:hypothetical protein
MFKVPEGHDEFLYELFRIFSVKEYQSAFGKKKRTINVLDVFVTCIMLCTFGESSENNLEQNAQLIEHKVNLLLLLFDLRGDSTMNISEVIIMLKTIIQSMGKVYPQANFFKDIEVLEEVKPAMYMIFQEYINKGINKDKEGINQPKGLHDEPSVGPGFIGFTKRAQNQESQQTLIPLGSIRDVTDQQSTSASPSSVA